MKKNALLVVFFSFLSFFYCSRNDNYYLYLPYTFFVFILIKNLQQPSLSFFLKFLSCLFVFGNWLKITIHGIFNYPYVEATGAFVGTRDQWDYFFIFSIVICFGLLFSSFLNLKLQRSSIVDGPALGFYRRNQNKFNQLAIALILLIYFVNWKYGFYRIGVARDLDLPLGLNAPMSFLVYLGAPMLAAILANSSVEKNGFVSSRALIYLAVFSVMAAATTYSRASLVVLFIPIALGMYRKSFYINGVSQTKFNLFLVLVPSVLITLATVSVFRIIVYGGAESVSRSDVEFYVAESAGLFFDRWVGAEGLMVSVSSGPSIKLFISMIMESPSVGVQSIYQNLAGSQYLNLDISNMTFLTLPGVFALLSFSGSVIIVFLGTLAVCFIGVVLEIFVAGKFRTQYPLHYLISGNLAYHFSQMIFPSLLVPFVIQIIFFVFLLGIFAPHAKRFFARYDTFDKAGGR